jgi:hypothetical protein
MTVHGLKHIVRMMHPNGSAPAFTVPTREIVALEHPMIVKNIDNGLKTLRSSIPLQQVSIWSVYFSNADTFC